MKLLVNIGVGPPVSGSPGFLPWLKCIANSSTSALMLWSLVHKGLCSPRLVRFLVSLSVCIVRSSTRIHFDAYFSLLFCLCEN